MKVSQATLLKLGAIACFWVAYRYAAHGKSLNDRLSLVIGCLLFAPAILMAVAGVWLDRNRS